jgi:hypothetical protein
MPSQLSLAIDNLYRVFAAYPLIEDVSYCRDHCVTAEEVATMHRTPLREVDADLMSTLVMNHGTWGDAEYFYHFAPRFLELATVPDSVLYLNGRMPEIWRYGPPAVQPAIDEFMAAWWQEVAAKSPFAEEYGVCAYTLLELIDECEKSPRAYLDAWPQGVHADQQLAVVVRQTRRLDATVFGRELGEWLAGPVPLARLEAAETDGLSDDQADEVRNALRLHLERLDTGWYRQP